MTSLTRFPSRIRFVNSDGTLTPEALRMLDALVTRVGGSIGDIGIDIFAPQSGEDSGHMAVPDVTAQSELGELAASEQNFQPAEHAACDPPPIVQQPAEPAPPEMLMQPQQVAADEIGGLGTMAMQDVGINFSGSITDKTVTVSNGIITSVK